MQRLQGYSERVDRKRLMVVIIVDNITADDQTLNRVKCLAIEKGYSHWTLCIEHLIFFLISRLVCSKTRS